MDSSLAQIKIYLNILYARRYWFLLTAVTVGLGIVIFTFTIPKQYEAKSTVFIEKNVVNSLLKGLTVMPSMEDRIRVLRYHMLSRDIISRVLRKLDMDVKSETPEAFESLIMQCQEVTKINMRGNDLFFVSLVSPDPVFARDYINALVNTYVEENLSSKREESFGADRFLSEQVKFYKQKLNVLEDEIYQYRKKTGIFSTVTEASIVEGVDTLETQVRQLQGKKNELIATVRTIHEQLASMEESASSGSGLFGGLDMMMGSDEDMQIEALQAKLDELLLVYNDSYPTVIKLRERISALEERKALQPDSEIEVEDDVFNPVEDPIFVDLKMRMNAAQSDLNALKARETELQNQINDNKRMLENFPRDKKALAEMERERSMVKNVYETLLERVGMAEVSKQMEVADKATTFRIVDPAILPTFPVGKARLLKMILGLIVGVGAGAAAVVAREHLDDTVRDADALRSKGVTVLAEIPLMLSDNDHASQKKKDKLVYSYCALCLSLIGLLMLHDLLGLSIIDQLLG
ncbi:XrtA system polysaccharide chain length determinant [uncultured Desulfuromonas sp.]|uniref:XrtA system polysaccharide chain length determinant n=1 Tax=uncultured Desulfuromonas sp. TaxID=181013 RepID=UPI002AAAE423|nr:XrtA system polysaccharide chain length determinant [uncultured Desulfuromonas sp.]